MSSSPLPPPPGRVFGRTTDGTAPIAVGAALSVAAVLLLLRALEVLPATVLGVIGDWWPVTLVAAGAWLVLTGRKATGLLVTAAGIIPLVGTHLRDDLVGPFLLILAGVVVLALAVGGNRLLGASPGGIALFGDVHRDLDLEGTTASLVGALGDVDATVSTERGGDVECLAIFGTVEVAVPADVSVVVRETAVFGDVRSPGPARGEARAEVGVTATAVFGDVRIRRI
jgi:hypothetical protein